VTAAGVRDDADAGVEAGPARIRLHRRLDFVDTDQSGRWHFTAALRLFEAAETELWERLGGKDQLGDLPRVHIETSYRRGVRSPEIVAVDVEVARVGRTSLTYRYAISTEGAVCAEGTVVVASLDPESGRPRPIPEPVRAVLETAGTLPEPAV
jgi:acyl-CoA thioesterase FadM